MFRGSLKAVTGCGPPVSSSSTRTTWNRQRRQLLKRWNGELRTTLQVYYVKLVNSKLDAKNSVIRKKYKSIDILIFTEIHEKNIEDDRKNSAVFVRGRANDGTRVGKK